MSGDAGEAAAQILDEHRSRRNGTCACGYWPTGGHDTHAKHLLHQLQMAGLDVVWR